MAGIAYETDISKLVFPNASILAHFLSLGTVRQARLPKAVLLSKIMSHGFRGSAEGYGRNGHIHIGQCPLWEDAHGIIWKLDIRRGHWIFIEH